ncbi:hypothetical protein TSAR_011178 [Trichomalopsis sarcophagae]|uniref:Chitin-binding type-4 domain-containing protein n=1 Tax=Trichomalopsis sarcophagae TaxID=543379 RepID=A0A232FEH9_9HYME|nr:hypothetical protein TSAR_011178 [Trichomalopsis sarcophagae]
MAFKLIFAGLLVVLLSSWEIDAHGRLMEPVNRGSAWRKGFKTPKNYDDNANFCGGFGVQHGSKNKGRCGTCGDNFADPQPRKNENGGKYGTGTIVRRYSPGEQIELQVLITANHMGHFEFSLCPLNSTMELETEECFDAHRLYLIDGSLEYPVAKGVLGMFNITVALPPGLTCEHCVLRWHYHCGNNWGICPNGTGRVGCGVQENFRTCSDIAIL